jgi:short-subunit dehydrogenase
MLQTFLLAFVLAIVLVALIIGAYFYINTRSPPYLHDIPTKDAFVVVTGAASGIGKSTVDLLVAKKCFVFALDLNETLLKESFGDNKQVKIVTVNIANTDQVKEAASVIEQTLSQKKAKLAGLVNCAGVLYREYCGLVETDESEMNRMFGVNVFGLIRMTNAMYPLLGKNASIVNIASIAALIGLPFMSYYSATKFAVRGYSDTLRREFLGMHRVSCVEPGGTISNIAAHTPVVRETSILKDKVGSMFKVLMGDGEPTMQPSSAVAQVIVSCLFSSNAPAHVFADFWNMRVKFFLSHAFGTYLFDSTLEKAYTKPDDEFNKKYSLNKALAGKSE